MPITHLRPRQVSQRRYVGGIDVRSVDDPGQGVKNEKTCDIVNSSEMDAPESGDQVGTHPGRYSASDCIHNETFPKSPLLTLFSSVCWRKYPELRNTG